MAMTTVNIINQAPFAENDSAATNEDAPVIVNVLANDWDPDDDPLSITVVASGLHGSTALNPDGTITYSPFSNFYGSDNFTYTLTDGHGRSATALVSMTVLPVNDPPSATNDNGETNQNKPISINVLANDFDIDGDGIVLSGFTQPLTEQ